MRWIVFSLDFELRWGVHDVLRLDRDAYRTNLLGVREAVPRLLDVFARRGVRATWATVGALACDTWDEYFGRAPRPPRYADPSLQVDPRYAELDPTGELHFAPDLIREIARTPGQEVGSHTFSHIYLGEPGVMRRDALADHRAIVQIFREKFDVTPASLVFPRNQVAFADVLRANGIRVWRGNETSWLYNLPQHGQHPLVRTLRMTEALNPWIHRSCAAGRGMTRSTLFLRVGLPDWAWRLHVLRIERECLRLRGGEVLHLWLHPHNLGDDPPLRIARMEQVLDVLERRRAPDTVWATMGDLIQPEPTAA
jgi:peptidoglycan/xylan/chitin deacetylase (PgdA/CDA1 family)